MRGHEGFYHYRQYSAIDLAEQRSLEDVWYLMFEGELPPAESHVPRRGAGLRTVPDAVRPLLPTIAAAGGPIWTAPHAVSLIGPAGFSPCSTSSPPSCGPTPCRSAQSSRRSSWRCTGSAGVEQPIDPHPDLGYAANYLYMITGEGPDPDKARAVEQYQIPRSTTGSTRRPSPPGSSPRRAPTSPRRSPAASARCRVRCTAARRPGRSTCSTPSARPTTPASRCRRRQERRQDHGLRPPCLQDRRPPIGVPARGRRAHRGRHGRLRREVERTVVDVLAELKPGRELYANVEFYAGVVMERAGCRATCSRRRSRRAGSSGGAPTSSSRPPTTASSGRARYVGPPPPQPVPEDRRRRPPATTSGTGRSTSPPRYARHPRRRRQLSASSRLGAAAHGRRAGRDRSPPGTDLFIARDDDGRSWARHARDVPIPTGRRAWIEDVIVDEAAAGSAWARR